MNLSGIIGSSYTPQPQQRQSSVDRFNYTQNNPQGPSDLGLGDVSSGLEAIDGVTDDFYTDYANLKAFVDTMYRNYNIDVTKPDVTNQDAVKAHELFLKSSASLMGRVNDLKNSQKMFEQASAQEMIGNSRIYRGEEADGLSFSQRARQGTGAYATTLNPIRDINNFLGKAYLGKEYDQAMGIYNEEVARFDDQIQQAREQGDYARASELMNLKENLLKPIDKDDQQLQLDRFKAKTDRDRVGVMEDNAANRTFQTAINLGKQQSAALLENVKKRGLMSDEDFLEHKGAILDRMSSNIEAMNTARAAGDEQFAKIYEAANNALMQGVRQHWNDKEIAEIEKIWSEVDRNEATAEDRRAGAEKKDPNSIQNDPLYEKDFIKRITETFTKGDRWEVGDSGMLETSSLNKFALGKNESSKVDKVIYDPENDKYTITFLNGESDREVSLSQLGDLIYDASLGMPASKIDSDQLSRLTAKLEENPPMRDQAFKDKIQGAIGQKRANENLRINVEKLTPESPELTGLERAIGDSVIGNLFNVKGYEDIAISSAPKIKLEETINLVDEKGESIPVNYLKVVRLNKEGSKYALYNEKDEKIREFRKNRETGDAAETVLKKYLSNDENGISKHLKSSNTKVLIPLPKSNDTVIEVNGKQTTLGALRNKVFIDASGNEIRRSEEELEQLLSDGIIKIVK